MLYLKNQESEGTKVPSLGHGSVLCPFPGGAVPEHGDSHSSSLAFPAGVGCFSKPSLCFGNTWNDLFMSSLSLVGI